ncbi:MAG: hypothetical protein OES84_04485, partial [Kiritimatiellaceae bacterium]|nr:hypothetical protein [Kiritimatiellaceae bacterium]
MTMNKDVVKKYLVGDFSFRRILRSLAFIYVALLLFGLFGSNGMIFQPQPCSYVDDEQIIRIPMDGGTSISAIYLAGPPSGFTVLYNHANAVDLGDIRSFLSLYRSLGFSVFSYDYPGYG